MSFRVEEAIGFFSQRINIGQFFGLDSEEVYITMNEPNEDDQFKLSKEPDEMKKLWKKYLDREKHNFVFDEKQGDGTTIEKPATVEQVIGILTKKGICLTYIIGQWFKTLPLPKTNDSK
jgi:hypothetical protein